MKTFFKSLLLLLLVVFIIIQFFGVDRTVPQTSPEADFLTIYSPPSDVENIFQSACYDCHSNETTYPWYSNIQPVGWWMQDHIDEARGDINFSVWADYPAEDVDHNLEEIAEEVEDGGMPLDSYTWAHSEARLTDQQRETLVSWVENLRASLQESTADTSSADADTME